MLLKKSWLPILLAFVLPLLLVYAWWGGFNTVTVTHVVRGPYVYAYLPHSGDYSRLPDTQKKAEHALLAQNVTPGPSIMVLYDDPRKVARGDLRAHVGYLIDTDTSIQPPLLRGEIPQRPVLAARVNAAVLLAPSKIYQALYDYQAERQADLTMPTVEFYTPSKVVYRVGVMTVEMQP